MLNPKFSVVETQCLLCSGRAFIGEHCITCRNCGYNSNNVTSIKAVREKYCRVYDVSFREFAKELGETTKSIVEHESGEASHKYMSNLQNLVKGKL